MNTSELIAEIDSEISRLRQVRALLTGTGSTGSRRAAQPKKKKKKKRHMSAEGRARIAAAQRARWAKQKRAKKTA